MKRIKKVKSLFIPSVPPPPALLNRYVTIIIIGTNQRATTHHDWKNFILHFVGDEREEENW